MIRKLKKIIYGATLLAILGTNIWVNPVCAADTTEEITTSEEVDASEEDATSEEANTTSTIEMYDEKDAMVAISLLYVDAQGNEYEIKNGYGFFVGDKNETVYLITCHHMVVLNQAEKQQIATTYAVEIDKISTKIKITLKGDVTVEAALENSSESMDFAIVKPATDLSGATTLRVCDDANINENGAKVYSYVLPELPAITYSTATDATMQEPPTGEKTKVDGEIQDWADINQAHYYKYTLTSQPTIGTPLLNDQGEVIGINTNAVSMDSGYYSSLQINEVTEIMKLLGLVYNPEIVIDTTRLDELLTEYEELDSKKYTDETWKIVEEKVATLQQFSTDIANGDVNYYTQGKLDTACDETRTAIDELKVKEKSAKEVTKVAIIIGIALAVIILTLAIILIVNKVKYKKKIEEEANAQRSAMEVLKMSGRVTPGSIYNNTNNMPVNKSLTGMAGYGGADDLGSETTILSSSGMAWNTNTYDTMEMKKVEYPPRLTRVKTGESVTINKNTFVLGKAPEMVDYCVRYNSGISRKHACIMKMTDGYYIQDLGTTNGTYVNDMRVVGDRYVKLVNGSIIKLADEAFEFTE